MCGQHCPCNLYNGEHHVHCPRGVLEYGTCATCQEACLKIHRPFIDGNYKWADCTDSSCGFCAVMRDVRAGRMPRQ